jgi:hypothetical protein
MVRGKNVAPITTGGERKIGNALFLGISAGTLKIESTSPRCSGNATRAKGNRNQRQWSSDAAATSRIGHLHEIIEAGVASEYAGLATLFIANIFARLSGPVLWCLRGRDLFATTDWGDAGSARTPNTAALGINSRSNCNRFGDSLLTKPALPVPFAPGRLALPR